MKRKIFLFLISLLCVSIFSFSLNSQPASAHSYYWWEHFRKVRVTKSTRIYKFNSHTSTYKRKPIRSIRLRKGRIVRIRHGLSYTWLVRAKHLQHGRYFWAADRAHCWYSLKLHKHHQVKKHHKSKRESREHKRRAVYQRELRR